MWGETAFLAVEVVVGVALLVEGEGVNAVVGDVAGHVDGEPCVRHGLARADQRAGRRTVAPRQRQLGPVGVGDFERVHEIGFGL